MLSTIIGVALVIILFAMLGPLLHECFIYSKRCISIGILLLWHRVRTFYYKNKARRNPTPENIKYAWQMENHFVIRAINTYIDALKTQGQIVLCVHCGFPRLKGNVACDFCGKADPEEFKEFNDTVLGIPKQQEKEEDDDIFISAVKALCIMGYSKGEAKEVVGRVIEDNPDSSIEEIIKLALKEFAI